MSGVKDVKLILDKYWAYVNVQPTCGKYLLLGNWVSSIDFSRDLQFKQRMYFGGQNLVETKYGINTKLTLV